jgi:hypothetical protein
MLLAALIFSSSASWGQLLVRKGAASQVISESFNNGDWLSTSARMPNDGFYVNRGKPATFFGIVSGTNERVMLLNPRNVPQYTRYGYYSSVPILPGVEVEARINTLQQGGTAFDGLFQLWVVNAVDSSKFVSIGMNAIGNDGSIRIATWTGLQEINSSQNFPYCLCLAGNTESFQFTNDTWYRVRITDKTDRTIDVSVWSDDGTQKLISHTFAYPLSDVGSRMYAGFSQVRGTAPTLHDLLVAVDSFTVKKIN